jgi:hypothetical protein
MTGLVLVWCVAVQVMTAKKRYEAGLSKLATTESSVTGMQVGHAPQTMHLNSGHLLAGML